MLLKSVSARIFSSLLVVMLIVGVLGTTVAQARQLSYGTYLPPTQPTSAGIKRFIDIVEQKTNNEIDFAYYPSASVVSAKTTLSAIKNGLVDAGLVVAAYDPTSLPVNMILADLSFFNKGSAITAAAVTDTIINDCPRCLSEFRGYNLHFLASYATSPYRMMCKDKMTVGFKPQGLRIRVPGEEIGRWVSQIGGVPINFPNSDIYEALERNQLDCADGVISWMHSLSLGEIVQSVIKLPMGASQGGTMINVSQQVWEDLDPKTQAIMRDAALEALARSVYIYINDDRKTIAEAKNKGVNFVEPSPALIDQREAFMTSEVGRAADNARSRGVDNPETVVHAFQKNLDKWRSLIKGKNLSEQQYYQLLKKNILADAGT